MPPSSTSDPVKSPADPAAEATETYETAQRRHRRRLWAQLLRCVYEVDPSTCHRCGAPMRVVAFIQGSLLIVVGIIRSAGNKTGPLQRIGVQ